MNKLQAKSRCWPWTGPLSGKGYGLIYRPGIKTLWAHRITWEALNGPIPAGLQIDHICRNHSCVNPRHMRVVTCRENVLAGNGHTAVNARKLSCLHGHALVPGNLYVHKGHRLCKTCRNFRNRSYKARCAAERAKLREEADRAEQEA